MESKTVIVTGSGQGIGRAIALAFAQIDFEVILIDRNEDKLKETKTLIDETYSKCSLYVADLSNPDQIKKTFQIISTNYHNIKALINNAGFGISASPYELTIEEWDQVVNTNLRGSFLCSREAASMMKACGGGAIIMIASTRALMSEPNSEAYAASKGGLLSLTHALAISLAPDNITVNAISPGWIETGDYTFLSKKDHLQHPSGRVGKPDDIARACIFLTNPENNFLTGANFVIDGGMTRKMIYSD